MVIAPCFTVCHYQEGQLGCLFDFPSNINSLPSLLVAFLNKPSCFNLSSTFTCFSPKDLGSLLLGPLQFLHILFDFQGFKTRGDIPDGAE